MMFGDHFFKLLLGILLTISTQVKSDSSIETTATSIQLQTTSVSTLLPASQKIPKDLTVKTESDGVDEESYDVKKINLSIDEEINDVSGTTKLPVSHWLQLMNRSNQYPYNATFMLFVISLALLFMFSVCILGNSLAHSTFGLSKDNLGRSTLLAHETGDRDNTRKVKSFFYSSYMIARVPFSLKMYGKKLNKAMRDINMIRKPPTNQGDNPSIISIDESTLTMPSPHNSPMDSNIQSEQISPESFNSITRNEDEESIQSFRPPVPPKSPHLSLLIKKQRDDSPLSHKTDASPGPSNSADLNIQSGIRRASDNFPSKLEINEESDKEEEEGEEKKEDEKSVYGSSNEITISANDSTNNSSLPPIRHETSKKKLKRNIKQSLKEEKKCREVTFKKSSSIKEASNPSKMSSSHHHSRSHPPLNQAHNNKQSSVKKEKKPLKKFTSSHHPPHYNTYNSFANKQLFQNSQRNHEKSTTSRSSNTDMDAVYSSHQHPSQHSVSEKGDSKEEINQGSRGRPTYMTETADRTASKFSHITQKTIQNNGKQNTK